MPRKFPWWSMVGIGLVLTCIVGYNLWAYNCGYCAIQDMKTIGPQVKGVGSVVLLAIACWLFLFFKRFQRKTVQTCSCGRQTTQFWSYCPDCGCQLR